MRDKTGGRLTVSNRREYSVIPVFGHVFGHATRIGGQIAMGITGYAARCSYDLSDYYLAREAGDRVSERTSERGAVPDACVFTSPGEAQAAIDQWQGQES